MRAKLILSAVLAGAAAVTAGCTGVPDREDEALAIRERVAAMAGVSDVDLIYDNGILEGTRFELSVDLDTATLEQIGAVADEIDTARGEDFADYGQRVTFSIDDRVSLNAGGPLPGDTAAVAERLRELDSRITAGPIDLWVQSDGTSRVDIRDAQDSGTVVDIALELFATRPLNRLEVHAPLGPATGASWWLRTWMTPKEKTAIDAQLSAAAPAVPRLVVVDGGGVVQLGVDIPSPQDAYPDIVRVIDALGAGPQRPMKLQWSWTDDPARYGDLRWSGSATIGSCDAPDANTASDGDLLPDAVAFQQRIRDEFGGCRK